MQTEEYLSQQSWQPANLSPNAEDNKALHRHIFAFFGTSRTMTSQERSENSDQSAPLHPMLPNADPGSDESTNVYPRDAPSLLGKTLLIAT